MRRYSGSFGVLQGSRVLFSDFANDGVMWTGTGAREVRYVVTFSERFVAPPVVWVGLSMWDVDHAHNTRVDLTTDRVEEGGFHLVFRTWGDTRIARVRADWTAMGPLRGEDEWDVA
jgi:hypothetical protein